MDVENTRIVPGNHFQEYRINMDLFNTDTGSIFKDRDTLQDGYIPDDLAGNTRDEEMQMLATALQPVIHGNTPDNVLLRGPNGSGKTAAVRIVLDVLQHEIKQIDGHEFSPIIVNGSQHNTGYQLTRDIANRLHPEEEYKQGGLFRRGTTACSTGS